MQSEVCSNKDHKCIELVCVWVFPIWKSDTCAVTFQPSKKKVIAIFEHASISKTRRQRSGNRRQPTKRKNLCTIFIEFHLPTAFNYCYCYCNYFIASPYFLRFDNTGAVYDSVVACYNQFLLVAVKGENKTNTKEYKNNRSSWYNNTYEHQPNIKQGYIDKSNQTL